jgi:trigger factor
MQVTVQRISPVVLELQVEVPADQVRTEVDKAYLSLGRTAHVRGFRPGKAPRSVLTHLYGAKISNDVASQIVNETLPKVLTDKNVTPVTRPTVEAGKFAVNEAFSYKARFEVHPDIENVTYEGFELVRPKLEATPEMVDEQIDALRQRHAAVKAPEPARPSQKGDLLTIDFTISVDGTEIKEAGGQGVSIELGSGQALPELDAALMEKSVGDVVTVDTSFPDTHQRPELRGKKGQFKVTVTEVKERVLPELDDEFAKDVGQFQTLIELRADVHSRLEQMIKEKQQTALAEQIIARLNERNPIEVPPSLVEQQCRLMETEFQAQARRMGQRVTQEQAQALHDRIHGEAEKKVRAGLLMAAIAKKGDFKVTEEDIEKGMADLAQQSGKNLAKVKAEYRDANKRQMLIGLILEDKILDLVEAKAVITDGPAEAPAADAPAEEAAKTATAEKAPSKKKSKKAEP